MGHKAKPIKPFLRQNKKGVFQYATVERELNELMCVGCTNTDSRFTLPAQLMARSRLLI